MSRGSSLMRSSPGFPYTDSNPTECLEMLGSSSIDVCSDAEEILSLEPAPVVVVAGGGKEETEVVANRGMRNDREPEMSRRRRKEVVGREEDCCTFPPVLTTLKWNGRPRFNYIRRVDDDRWRLVITMERSENWEVGRVVTEDGRIAFILVSPSDNNDMGVVGCRSDGDGVVKDGVAGDMVVVAPKRSYNHQDR